MHVPGCYYHVYNRGVNRQRIFANEGNYRFLLRRAKRYLKDYEPRVIAYCLMPNHYHLLPRPEADDALSRFVQRLFNSYSQAFNRQQGRSGTLFEGRAKSILVDDERYVLYLCRYVHLNPVKAKLVGHPGEWPYSNYLEWVERRSGALVDHAFIEAYFSTPTEYESFVTSDIEESLERELRSYSWNEKPCEGCAGALKRQALGASRTLAVGVAAGNLRKVGGEETWQLT